jgi:MOSC domain-containing protein
MPRIVALYRYPVKGFTPETCERLTVLDTGRIEGDRALGFRFGNSELPEDAWSRKHGFTVLVNTPGLARLETRYDHDERRLTLAVDGKVIADETLDDSGRRRLEAAVERFVLSLPENPLADHAERRPLRLIGDGVTPRYQDSEQGQVTLHSRASLAALAGALGTSSVDEMRFRSNIAIEGVPAWEEQDWIGRRVRIGDVELDVTRPKTRCLATHANPETGERDLPVMQTLVRAFGQQQPTFAVALMTHRRGGEIRVGDEVKLVA